MTLTRRPATDLDWAARVRTRRGKYSTSESECRAKHDFLKKRWAVILPRLQLWLSGQSARHSKLASDGAGPVVGGRERFRAIARIAASRYMPSPTALSKDDNGLGLWEPASQLPREDPVVKVNTAVLKLGLGRGQDLLIKRQVRPKSCGLPKNLTTH
jgi:hypothetical protein